nr:hypothetical protein Hi04_10k_c2089_00012 [uncultured bacterium]
MITGNHFYRRALLASIACLPFVIALPALAATSEAPGTSTIAAAQMKDYLSFIASDEMEGRNTPSRGLDTTAKFIATLLSRWGVKPGGDAGSYFQHIDMSAVVVHPEKCTATVAGHNLMYGADFMVRNTAADGDVNGAIVYVGDGRTNGAAGHDSYKGVDAKGKIVLVHMAAQRGFGFGEGRGGAQVAPAAGVVDPEANAKAHGAIGIVYLAAENTNIAQQGRFGNQARFGVDKFAAPSGDRLPSIVLAYSAAAPLFHGEKMEAADLFKASADGKPADSFELAAAKTIAFKSSVETQHASCQNVVGIIEGSDPVLKNEYVGLSAHYDHIGMTDNPVNGDHIYNGADDDGSGTTAILATAEALARARTHPKRSVVIVWHMGEEKGLWGSRYFTTYPTINLKQVAAWINIDMIGRSKKDGDANPANKDLTGPDGIYVIGATMMSSELEALTKKVNDDYLKLKYDYKYDDPKDPNRFFYRSDHINYARQGIPILFFFDGVHEDYHRLGDEVSKIDFYKMEKVTRTIYQELWALGTQNERPKVDKPTPEQLR